MTENTSQLSSIRQQSRVEASSSASPTWWVVFLNEAHGLWVGGKAPILILLFSIVLGFQSFVTAYNVELSLRPPKEMVYETLKTAISVGLFIGMIIGADMLSGDRERGTLESLLLTPTRRRQMVVGKFLAALTPWPAALVLSIPYMAVLAQGDEVLAPAVLWGALLGTILTIAYTGTGMFVSFWANSNRTSYLVSLGIFVLILVPAQLPGRAQTGAAGQFLQQLNPLAAQNHFLSKILVNNRTFEEFGSWLWSPIVFAVLMLILLLVYAAPGLRIEGGKARLFPWKSGRLTSVLVLVTTGLILVLTTFVASARENPSQIEQPANPETPLGISIDMAYQTVKTGDPIFFDTVVTNLQGETAPPTIVAMNIINLDQEGDVVDPEDWSPERTQYIDQLSPGDSSTLSWRVNAILDGDYIVYMVAMPEPASRDDTSQAVASSGIHLTVMPFTRLNPRGIVPLVIGAPLVLGLGTLASFVIRRRETQGGGSNTGPLRLSFVVIGVVLGLAALAIVAVASQSDGTSPVSEPALAAEATSATESSQASSTASESVLLEIDTSTDATDFSYVQEALEAPAGSTITLTFNNRTDPDDEVGHNWVLVVPGQEESVIANAIAAGDNKDWLDVNDPGIITHTRLIEGDESDSVTFDAPAPGTYTYLCTFPEHYEGGMRGTLTIK